jgi:hypothetical protein
VIGICVFSALCPGYPAFWGKCLFSRPNSPLEPDWKTIREIFHYQWKSSLLTRLADQFWIQVFGSERGSHLIRRCSLGWAYDAGRRYAGFDSPPLLSFISRLSLRFCFTAIPWDVWNLVLGRKSCLGSWRFLSCFWVLVWGSLLDRIRLIWRFWYRWSRMIA